MSPQEIKDTLWLLQVCKQSLPYASQREHWNRIQAAVRQEIKEGCHGDISDFSGPPLDLYAGTYQD